MKTSLFLSLSLLTLLALTKLWHDRYQKGRIPAATLSTTGIDVEYTGELIAIADDTATDKRHHRIDYYLRDQKRLQKINLTNPPAQNVLGKRVDFRGTSSGGIPQGIIVHGPVQQADVKPVLNLMVDERKMLVLLFKFNNSMQTYITAQQAQEQIFNGAFQNFFTTITDGRLHHSGQVYGWYHLNRIGEMGQGDMICEVTRDEVLAAITHYNINIQNYDSIAMISNCTEYGTIGGRANLSPYDFLGIGKNLSFIKMATKPSILDISGADHPRVPGWRGLIPILVHERGHNLGFGHADGLDCGESQVLYPCEHVEYGNRFDKMGASNGAITFNGDSQLARGWKKETEFIHVKSDGEFYVEKLTSTARNRKIGAYIYEKGTNKKLFYVESRKPHSLDSNLLEPWFSQVANGLLIYSNMGTSTLDRSPKRGNYFRIIDAKPTEANWDLDTDYESMDDEFFDPMTGVTIRTVGKNSNGIHFTVEYNDSQKVCGNTTVPQSISKPYIRLYYTPTMATPVRDPILKRQPTSGPADLPRFSKEVNGQHIILIPGDYFHLKINSILSEEMMCERINFVVEGLMSDEFKNFKVTTSGGTTGGTPHDPDTGIAGRDPIVVPIPGGGTAGSNDYRRTLENMDKVYEFPLLKVPASALNKNFKVSFTATRDGQVHKQDIYFYIRATRAPIAIPHDNSLER